MCIIVCLCVWKLNWIFGWLLLHIWFAVCFFTEEDNFIKCFTWLDGNDSDKFPGLIEDTY